MSAARRLPAVLFLLAVSRAVLHAAEVTTVYDLRFFSGQHFFDGGASDVSGNAEVMVAPSIKFNERWSLLPTYTGGYQGTRDVQELAGGGTLFQDSTRHGLTVKGIRRAGEAWKLKAALGANVEWLRETKDEDWGDGLFDHRRYSAGWEAEFSPRKDRGGRLAYDYFLLTFPNYTSLESSLDSTLSRELAGEDVLDSANHLLALGGWCPLPGRGKGTLTAHYNLRGFADQPVLNTQGAPTGTDRQDKSLSLRGSAGTAWSLFGRQFWGELGLGWDMADSDQNHYDVRKTQFFQNYYDYSQWSLAPSLTAALGAKPCVLTLGASYARRAYSDRPIQNSSGDYLTDKLDLTLVSASAGVTYPLNERFKARFLGTLSWSDSNMKYDKVFRYNYRIANYLLGFSYEY